MFNKDLSVSLSESLGLSSLSFLYKKVTDNIDKSFTELTTEIVDKLIQLCKVDLTCAVVVNRVQVTVAHEG